MAGKQKETVRPRDEQDRRDALLLDIPRPNTLTREQLYHAVEMLAICRSSCERQVIGLRLLHRMTLPDVASIQQTPARVAEIWGSVSHRHQEHIRHARQDLALAKALAEKR